MKVRLIVFVFFFLINSQKGFSQSTVSKWGKISKSEIQYKECAYETTADAVILSSQGFIEFRLGSSAYLKKHVRIKILKEEGIRRADVSLPYYVKNDLEKIVSLKAQTINIDDQGKAIIQKVENDQVFDVQSNENWKEKRFVFPSVKVGSIIEYQYDLVTNNITFLEGWTFQDEIPTLYSGFKASIPDYLDYRVLLKGGRLVQKYSDGKPTRQWDLEELPSIKDEPFTTNYKNYHESLRFQLAGYHKRDAIGTGIEYVNLMTTWESLAKEILTEERFGNIINKSGKAKNILASLNYISKSDLEKLKIIYDYVKNNYTWNHNYAIFPSQNLNSLLQEKKGNSAEINLLLTLLLQEAGFVAHPTLLSTRSHGNIVRVYPLLTQFNHVVTYVKLDNNEYLLNATDPFRPFDLLSKEDLNESAFILDIKEPRWIEINITPNSRSSVFATYDLLNPDLPSVTFSYSAEGYKNVQRRKEIYKEKNPDLIFNSLNLFSKELKVDSIEIKNVEEIDKPLLINGFFKSSNLIEKNEDLVFLKPLIMDTFEENPFKTEKRYYPVDFGYPSASNQTIIIKIPAGYKVEELPESLLMKLPEDYGSYMFHSVANQETIKIVSKYHMAKTEINPHHYQALREFFDLVLAKMNQMVILKKI